VTSFAAETSTARRLEHIAAHPDMVRIELAGRAVDVVAEQLHGALRDQA
jgi:hypothetical protein